MHKNQTQIWKILTTLAIASNSSKERQGRRSIPPSPQCTSQGFQRSFSRVTHLRTRREGRMNRSLRPATSLTTSDTGSSSAVPKWTSEQWVSSRTNYSKASWTTKIPLKHLSSRSSSGWTTGRVGTLSRSLHHPSSPLWSRRMTNLYCRLLTGMPSDCKRKKTIAKSTS